MKISVFIPCVQEHYQFIPALIRRYQLNTRVPDEIVVFVSGVKNKIEINNYENVKYFIVSEKRVHQGEARQWALNLCLGDIVSYQDADDTPHRQRIEIIERIFHDNDIVCLTHSYYNKFGNTEFVDYEKIKKIGGKKIYDHYFPNDNLRSCISVSPAYGGGLMTTTAGTCSIKKEILKEVKWRGKEDIQLSQSGAEDYDFCMEVAHKYKKSMMIDAPLYYYIK